MKGLRALSDFLNRAGLASALGQSFGGKRDIYKVFGWKKCLTFQDYDNMHRRNGIAKRVITAPASATWRNPPTIKKSDSFKKEWDKLVEEHDIWSQIERADRLAGIGNYSILLLGFSGSGKMETPVVHKEGQELIYVQPYGQQQAIIKKLDDNPNSPRFGMPEMYTIKLNQQSQTDRAAADTTQPSIALTLKVQDFDVHFSRVVHIAEELTMSNFLGTPRIECCYNDLQDLEKVSGGSAEAFWLGSNRGMQIDVDKDMDLSPEDAEALDAEVEEYQHELRRVMRTKGVKINHMGSNIPDPKNTANLLLAKISGATGIPQRILIGSEAGQLASDQDRANWSDRITERRVHFAEPCVLNPIVEALMNAGTIPEAELDTFEWDWPPNFQLTPLENAQSMAQKARAAINLGKSFVDGEPLLTKEEAREIMGFATTPAPGMGTIPTKPTVLPPATVPGTSPKGPKGSPGKGATDHQPNDFSAKES